MSEPLFKSSHKSNKIIHKKLKNLFCSVANTVQFQYFSLVLISSPQCFIPFWIYSLELLIPVHQGYNGKPRIPAFLRV